MTKTVKKSDFVYFLNTHSPEYESEEWIIGGILRCFHRMHSQYGNALRKHDPIGFNVGFKEYERKFNTKM
jgi:hypothetical protein